MKPYCQLFENIAVHIDGYGIFDRPVNLTVQYKAVVQTGKTIYIQDYKVIKEFPNGMVEVKTKEFSKQWMVGYGTGFNRKAVRRQVWKEVIMDDQPNGLGMTRRLLPGDLQEGTIRLKVEGIAWERGSLAFDSNFEVRQ